MVQTKEEQKNLKKTDISYITYFSKDRRLLEKFFFSYETTIFLKSLLLWLGLNGTANRWYRKPQKKKKFFISPISRKNRRLLERLFTKKKNSIILTSLRF